MLSGLARTCCTGGVFLDVYQGIEPVHKLFNTLLSGMERSPPKGDPIVDWRDIGKPILKIYLV